MVNDLKHQANGHSGPSTAPYSDSVRSPDRLAAWPVTALRREGDGAAPGGEARPSAPPSATAAEVLAPLLQRLFREGPPVRFVFWDQSSLGPPGLSGASGSPGGSGAVFIRSPNALQRLVWSPNELGVARAFVAGDLDIDGDMYRVLRALHESLGTVRSPGPQAIATGLSAAVRLGASGRR